ncbi:HVO_A0556 family zinc finger protein [Halosimplex amylolyticum]|uniref:HVO_A0556 family zinc finger protein n=1 Tax=Halosimplex amylolyticum TaxID=3396616 RepID=UPI003F56C277
MSDRELATGRDAFRRLRGTACPRPSCDGQVRADEYKGSDALLCEACSTPILRLCGDR